MATSSMMDRQYGQQTEGTVAKAIEKQTSKLPSDVFLWAAVSSMATSRNVASRSRAGTTCQGTI